MGKLAEHSKLKKRSVQTQSSSKKSAIEPRLSFVEQFEANLRKFDFSKDPTTGPVIDVSSEEKEEALLGITAKADRDRLAKRYRAAAKHRS